ncbi:MAG: ribosome biogenesis GTPase Der [Bauldia sp.]|uniref:ribosome biogenesis GTPase Der n=1 Tax=Bauldia sp. TaxID=2575872 RepID=UPI001DE43D7D|nr:ribosome biogenesis GTPase Der [Bauldia sp.]MCB1497431.1 ribosome biogenesis GTPase Der [Bauldia sp.]
MFDHAPRVVIIGRPNVGKSTLFNRLVGRKLALVDDRPGVTRDRREGEASLHGLDFTVIDTAGLEEAAPDSLAGRMRAQTEAAVDTADLTLFMIDTRAGVTPLDAHFASLLHALGKPVVLIANKAEGKAGAAGALEAYELGFGEPLALSAEHGEGMSDLHDAIVAALPEEARPEPEDGADKPIRIAVIGRPNAGKSTLINRMIGEERLLTGPEAGITRDAIAVDWTWRDQAFRVFDTAGMRRRAKVVEKLEKLAVGDALRAIRFAEVVILVLDATKPFDKQDLQIAALVESEGRAVVIALDKWDLIEEPQAVLKELRIEAERLLPQIRGVALVPVSGLTGRGIDKMMARVIETYAVWNRRVSTSRLNRWLAGVVEHHPPPAVSGRRIKLRYLTQAKARPPSFVAFCSRPEALPAAWQRYLVNTLRDDFKLPGVPIRLMLRKGENPFEGRKRKRS